MTLPWSARDLPDSPPLSMPRPKVCRFSCSMSAPLRTGRRVGTDRELSGFPNRHIGMALAGRAFNQALKFGVEIAIPLEVARLDCSEAAMQSGPMRLDFTNGGAARARTVVVASGASYR